MVRDKKIQKLVIVYTIIFFAVWTVYGLFIASHLDGHFSEEVTLLLKEMTIKSAVWGIPALLLIKRNSESLNVKWGEMFSLKRGWGTFLPVFIIFTLYITVSALISGSGHLVIKANIPISFLGYLFVGFNEELVFRGWLLNTSAKDEKDYKVMGVNALLFTMIHFPRWIEQGIFKANMLSFAWLTIPILSIVFSVTFLKSRNIVIPALLHCWWDFLLEVLI